MTVHQRSYYDLTLDPAEPSGQPRCIRLMLKHGDKLRAELEGKRRNVALTDSLNLTTLILWCAALRQGDYDEPYEAFVDQVVDYDEVPAAMHGLEVAVDPTRPAADTGSPSSSPTTSQPLIGSIPTSTST